MCEKTGRKEGNAVTILSEPIHRKRDAIIQSMDFSQSQCYVLSLTGRSITLEWPFDCESGSLSINPSINQALCMPLCTDWLYVCAPFEGMPVKWKLKLKFEARAMSSPDPGACFGLSQTANTSSHTISICSRKDTSTANDGHISQTFNPGGPMYRLLLLVLLMLMPDAQASLFAASIIRRQLASHASP
ncbi:hypothetical protein TWF281_009954 [Arthrobotrys megalospora]